MAKSYHILDDIVNELGKLLVLFVEKRVLLFHVYVSKFQNREFFRLLMEPSVQLSDRLMSSYGVGRVFKDHTKTVNSIDFSVDGM